MTLIKNRFAKFSRPFSLRSNSFENLTAESGCATLGLPTRHMEMDRKIEVEKVKNARQKYTVERKNRSAWDATAANERFCVIAAVIPQIIQCKLASYYPAASSVEAATTQSRHHVRRQRGTAQRKT
jgi:hypothetical protein